MKYNMDSKFIPIQDTNTKANEDAEFERKKQELLTQSSKSVRRYRNCCFCFVFILVCIGVAVGVLYPRQPNTVIDRNELIKTVQVQSVGTASVPEYHIGGYMMIGIQNTNVYNIEIFNLKMNISTITPDPVSVLSTVPYLSMPSNELIYSNISLNMTLGGPGTNFNAIAQSVVLQCVSNDNIMTMNYDANATVRVFGYNMSFSVTNQDVEAYCLAIK